MQLHELGYTYLGPTGLYNLTWIEVFRLTDAGKIISDQRSGLRKTDLSKFEEYQQKMKEKQSGR